MHNVSYKDKNSTFSVSDKEVLFNALDDQGETLPHGCLAGSCGVCKVEIIQGHENLNPMSMIEENTIEAVKQNLIKIDPHFDSSKHIRLSCRAKVCGDIEFKAV